MRDRLPLESHVEVVMALYDGLAWENRWCKLSAEQFEGVRTALRKALRRPSLDDRGIQKALIELEEVGVDTTPIPSSSNKDDVDEES
ncbi:MAG: hypothetical protein WBP34_02660 [Thermoanaerobaculia bacterium]